MSRYLPLSARPLGLALLSAGLGVALLVAGSSTLPLPSGWTSSDIVRWVAVNGWLIAVFAVARLLLVAAAVLVSVGSVVAALAVATGTDRRPPRWLRQLVQVPGGHMIVRVALGLGASGVLAAACGSSASLSTPAGSVSPPTSAALLPGAHEAPPVLRNTTVSPSGDPTGRGGVPRGSRSEGRFGLGPANRVASRASPAPTPAVRPRRAASGPSASAPVTRAGSGEEDSAAPTPSAVPPASTASVPGGRSPSSPIREWVVRPGDSLWSISESTAGSVDRVSAYWLELIALNRARLPVPTDPSLLFPGETILLPPLHPDPP